MLYLIRLNQFLWSGPVLVLLMGLHLYYTVHLRFVQRKIGEGIRLSLGDDTKPGSSGFSRFGSLTTTLAATLGTGNIIGISTAVYLGGPGAVFWCWLTGVFGMATTYAETFLCSRFRFPDKHGTTGSGPMYLLQNLLHRRTMAFIYSAALCFSAFFIGCTTQSNALTETCEEVFGIPSVIMAIVTAFAVGVVLMQGQGWIEKFSMAVVPTMAIFFFGSCLLYLILHASFVLPALGEIIHSAFSPSSIGGGIAGFTVAKAIRYGVARGLFTNEAGLGTAGLVAGNSAEEKADSQALVSMSASFWDTVILCAVTGLVLVAFQLEYPAEWPALSAGSLTAGAFSKLPFLGDEILAIAIFCFALATLVGWSYLGMRGFTFLFSGKGQWVYHTIYITMIFVGGIMPLSLVWELTDFINLFLLIPSFYLLIKCRNFF
ncbi:MAG: amino acid carrier protein [Eubacterium sp.]|nr:amino acid carrier protein [Eubacterium sp.]